MVSRPELGQLAGVGQGQLHDVGGREHAHPAQPAVALGELLGPARQRGAGVQQERVGVLAVAFHRGWRAVVAGDHQHVGVQPGHQRQVIERRRALRCAESRKPTGATSAGCDWLITNALRFKPLFCDRRARARRLQSMEMVWSV